MELQPQVIKTIKELPASHRVTAFALKKINQKVQKIYQQQKRQIDQNHHSFLSKFKQIENKASEIIMGRQLNKQDISTDEQYFNEAQQSKINSALKSAKPIENYWLTAVKNSALVSSLSPTDEQMITYLQNVESNVTVDKIEIVLTFKDSEWLKGGKYRRSIKMSSMGIPEGFQGDELCINKFVTQEDKQVGLFNSIGKNTEDPQQSLLALQSVSYFTNQLVPYSLEFYLGKVDEDDFDQDFDQEDLQDDEDDEQEQQPVKKQKK